LSKEKTENNQIYFFMRTKSVVLVMALTVVSILAISFAPRENEPSLILIKTIEKPNGTVMQSGAIAVYKDGEIIQESQLIDLDGKTINYNLKVVGDKIRKYKSEGYELISSVGGGGTNTITFTYILEKK
jgi:hypothetical protein